jgi:hypothetical protein
MYCSGCCLSSSSLCLFPTEQLQVLDVSDNDLGHRFSSQSCPSKRSFDECLLLGGTAVNTILQVRTFISFYFVIELKA